MTKEEQKADLKLGCRIKETEKNERKGGFNNLFDSEWEVFVIKKDYLTGQFVGKTACCALSKV